MFTIAELLKAAGGLLVSGDAGIIVEGISIDSRSVKKNEAFLAIKGERFDGHDFIDEVVSKGVKCVIAEEERKRYGASFIQVKDTTKALGDIARFNRNRFKHIPLIAVTGSNGKTTVKEMIAWILSSKFKVLKNEGTKNNQIGLPLTLLKLDNSYDLAVLEIGTNHFGEVSYLSKIARANIGVITNIGPSHLEYLKNLKGVFKEKYALLRNLKQPAIAILNTDDKFLRKEALKKRKTPFVLGAGIEKASDFSAGGVKYISGKPSFVLNKRFSFALPSLGYYNIYNSLLAIATARIFGLGYRDISFRLSRFDLPKSRLNFIEIKGISFIDDTYNSNPLSMKQALGVLGNFSSRGRKIMVMGDMLELGAQSISLHADVIKEALKLADTLITVGPLTKSCLVKVNAAKNNIFACQTSSEAREILFKRVCVGPEDIVLVKGSRGMKMEEVFKI
ncbi:MAG: UDP-N-acetylmuramoyl-tripeptide--D-alanyl-D-alanine ligase [Candidatus Omnitrophota bacterium]|nr:UDP-N-acetylmuramoyl-tripeptide--D-alanyl-D-alanine ligase [Candidatus Omnitrophota bacterium]